MSRRDPLLGLLTLVVVLSTLPAFSLVLDDVQWRPTVIVTATLAVGTGLLLRLLRTPWWVALPVGCLALVLLSTALHLPAGPLLPGGEEWALLRDLFAQGMTELRETPAPAPTLPGLLVLLTTIFWVVAFVVHELSVRWRRTALALVPALVLWAVPLAIAAGDAGVLGVAVPFLAAAGLLLLVSAPDTLPIVTERLPRASTVGIGFGVVAVAVAVTVPGILPGYGEPGWVALGGRAEPRGYQPIVDVSDRLKLPSERDVLRVRSDRRTYLRLAGLDSFDGHTWRLGPIGEGAYRPDPESLYPARDVLPPEADAAQIEPLFVDVEVLELENIYVPVPYQPVQILGPPRNEMVWSTEGGFLATWDTEDGELAGEPRVGIREGVSYRVQAARPAPSYDDLVGVEIDGATRERHTTLPREYPALRAQAEQVYAAADAQNDVDRALALQSWFIGDDGGFTYDLDVPALRGDDALERFVLEDKVGYCEYFATAMAVMLRETGIPARVAVGFLPGRLSAPANPELGRDVDEYTVSTRDAHAWVEVLFPGYGWITFEPTPRDDQTQMVPREDDLLPLENERERAARERAEAAEAGEQPDAAESSPDDVLSPEELDTPRGVDAPETGGTQEAPPSRWPLVVLLLGLIALVWAVGRRRSRVRTDGTGDTARVLAAQRHLLATAAAVGCVRRPSETTPELLARWRDEGRVDGDAAVRFSWLAQAAAFGGRLETEEADEAERIGRHLEGQIRASVTRVDRVLAPVRVPVTEGVARVRGTLRAHNGHRGPPQD